MAVLLLTSNFAPPQCPDTGDGRRVKPVQTRRVFKETPTNAGEAQADQMLAAAVFEGAHAMALFHLVRGGAPLLDMHSSQDVEPMPTSMRDDIIELAPMVQDVGSVSAWLTANTLPCARHVGSYLKDITKAVAAHFNVKDSEARKMLLAAGAADTPNGGNPSMRIWAWHHPKTLVADRTSKPLGLMCLK